MEKRNFEEWLETFTDNINNWNYYVNYQTAYRNTATVKRQLALLNTLKGVDNIADEFKDLVNLICCKTVCWGICWMWA